MNPSTHTTRPAAIPAGVIFTGCELAHPVRESGFAMAAGGGAAGAAQPGSRRSEVVVKGRRVKTIDIHAHCVIPRVADVLRGSGLEGDFPRNQILGPD
ncbi:MAG: hypothetical protein ACXWUB_07135, partial [Burkholderiales bacterium]